MGCIASELHLRKGFLHISQSTFTSVFYLSKLNVASSSYSNAAIRLACLEYLQKKPVIYKSERIKGNPVELHLDVDITNGSTGQDKSEIDKAVNESVVIPPFLIELMGRKSKALVIV